MVDYAPFQGEDDFEGVRFADRPAPAPGQSIREEWRRVTDGFFEAAGLTILGGRGFGTVDFEGTPAVAVVNRAFADKHWSGRTAVGRRFDLSPSAYRSLEVVGVVEDVPTRGFATPPPPMVYVPLQGSPRVNMALFVRATGDPLERLDAIREAVWSVDSTQPIDRVFPMTALVEKAGARVRPRTHVGCRTRDALSPPRGWWVSSGVVGFAVRGPTTRAGYPPRARRWRAPPSEGDHGRRGSSCRHWRGRRTPSRGSHSTCFPLPSP